MEPPNVGPWLSATGLNANPDSQTFVNIPSPSANFSALVSGSDPALITATDAQVQNGAVMLTVDAPAQLGLANAACATVVPTSFVMMDATTNNADLVTPAGPATDLLRNLAEDSDGVVGIPNHVEHYPSYLNRLLDPDGLAAEGGGPIPPIVPFARYSGFDSVANTTVILQVLFFTPGALRALPNSGAHIASQGNQLLVVLQDPTLPPANSSITDFCSPLTSESNFFGVAHDNACTPVLASCVTLTLGGSIQRKGVDAACNTGGLNQAPDESDPPGSPGSASCAARFTNPASTRTVQALLQGLSQRDFDGDGIEQALDPCNRSWSDPDGVPGNDGTPASQPIFDPRAPIDAANDGDNDGLDKSCDPNDASAANDPDGDAWFNRLDNCPIGVPNGGARNLNNTQAIRERHRDNNADSNYTAGEDIWLDNDNNLVIGVGDTQIFDGASPSAVGDALIRFRGPEAFGGAAPFERHVDSNIAGTQAGRYKVVAGESGGIANLGEAIVRDVNNDRRFDAGDVILADDASSPNPAIGDLLIGFLPEAKHISVITASGIQTGDNITIGPASQGAAKTDFDRNNITLERGGAGGIVSWEPTAQPSLTGEPSATANNDPVTIKFVANSNRGQADFDVKYPGPTLDGGQRFDTIGPPSAADVGCDVTADAPCPTLAGCTIWGTSGPGFNDGAADVGGPDGHYHRAATLARMCISNNQAADDSDGDGVCETGGGVLDPNDANTNSDGDAVPDRNDNCISVSNSPPAGFTQADKDQDGFGDACDQFNDSDGDGFSDRLEGASGIADDASGLTAGLGAEEGTFCNNATDDDSDGAVNDGCPRAGAAEVACGAAGDNDLDTFNNDGCPAVNAAGVAPAGTYQNVGCPRGVTLNPGGVNGNAHPLDTNGDGNIDITDVGDFSANFGKTTVTGGGTAADRLDVAPDAPSALGGGLGDNNVDITDLGAAVGSFGKSSC